MAEGPGMERGPRPPGGNMLSSYFGRWASVAVFVFLAALTAAAILLEPDYPARVPIRIGVTAFDEMCAAETLDSFASRVREDDGGEITWVWLGAGAEPSGCDFYLMTAPHFAAARGRGLECLLLASAREDGKLSMGVIVTAAGSEPDWSRTAFTSSFSATGFLSPLTAMAEAGVDLSSVSFETLADGCPARGDEVVLGISLGRFGAGGLALEELRRLERSGLIGPGDIRILMTGPGLPEIVLAADRSTEQWKSAGFTRRLPRIADRLSGALSREMSRLGMASFRPPAEGELGLVEDITPEVLERAGYHFP